jgi:hypothetical protein
LCPHYRAYTIGPDGGFVDFLNIEAEDDLAAIEAARCCLQTGRSKSGSKQGKSAGWIGLG